jgi:hypothetical protein
VGVLFATLLMLQLVVWHTGVWHSLAPVGHCEALVQKTHVPAPSQYLPPFELQKASVGRGGVDGVPLSQSAS